MEGLIATGPEQDGAGDRPTGLADEFEGGLEGGEIGFVFGQANVTFVVAAGGFDALADGAGFVSGLHPRLNALPA